MVKKNHIAIILKDIVNALQLTQFSFYFNAVLSLISPLSRKLQHDFDLNCISVWYGINLLNRRGSSDAVEMPNKNAQTDFITVPAVP